MMHLFAKIIFVCSSCLLMYSAHADAPIGRLFSTPEERSQLDSLRKSPKKIEAATQSPLVVNKQKELVLPAQINLQGYVKRNDGKQGTIWINGEAVQESSRNNGVQVGKLPANSNRVPIQIPANGKRITLKAGQVYDPVKNLVRESRTSVQGNSGRIGD